MDTKPLKQLLIDHDISQSWLALEVNVSPATISQIVNHDLWPKRRAAELRTAIDTALTSNAVPPHQIKTALFPTTPTATVGAGSKPAQPTTQTPQQKDDPMLLRKQTLTQTARKHFGLMQNPFTSDIQSANDLYLSPDIRYVREALITTAKNGGFIAVTGESGAGKTTLKRDLIDRIQREKLSIINIEPYVLAAEDNDIKGKTLKSSHIAEAILFALAPNINAKRSPEARFRQIHTLLAESSRAGNQHVIIIEEAHCLPIPTLKHLKRFFELEDGFKKLISIILIGQNELTTKLSEQNQEVREVVQRCEIVTLDPIAPEQLHDYLTHRCKVSGNDLAKLITADGIDAIATRLTGTQTRKGQPNRSLLYPLAIGNLITGALNAAAELGAPIVDADVVREV